MENTRQPSPITCPGAVVNDGALNLNLGPGSQTNYNQIGDHNSQYNAKTINIHGRETTSQDVANWFSPSNSWTNHNSARRQQEPGTGTWLIESTEYKRWKHGEIPHIWLHGKPGCGKTVLCSTVVEDLFEYCKSDTSIGLAVFYFSFSDERKQNYSSFLQGLLAQLVREEPCFSTLKRAYENKRMPDIEALEDVLCQSANSYSRLFLAVDALDECPEESDARHDLLQGLQRLAKHGTKLRFFLTSREYNDIREWMDELGPRRIASASSAVDEDIRKYVSGQLANDGRLSRFKASSRTAIEKKISENSNGMFRWANLQLQELKNLKSIRPSFVQNALDSLPLTLDATYERMLTNIEQRYRKDALTLLYWLTYSIRPLRLDELAQTVVIDSEEKTVYADDCGDIGDALNILTGLVVLTRGDSSEESEEIEQMFYMESDSSSPLELDDDASSAMSVWNSDDADIGSGQRIKSAMKVRLAHFSVKQYLELPRIDKVADFHLESTKGHHLLTKSCLMYMMHYSNSIEKKPNAHDLRTFPLLRYAAKFWPHHSLLHQSADVTHETEFLMSEVGRSTWLTIYRPNDDGAPEKSHAGSPLYYASYFGLEAVVKTLLICDADVNVQGGYYGNALQAASYSGHMKVVEMLLSYGADVNVQGGFYDNALQAASYSGHVEVIEMLLAHGADVNVQEGYYGNALQASSDSGHVEVIEMLLAHGADVNVQGGFYGSALQAASFSGCIEAVETLLAHGADVNVQGGFHGNALQAASRIGYTKAVEMLLAHGADVNVQGGFHGNALQAASFSGHVEVIEMLLAHGADVNAEGGHYGNALQAASFLSHIEAVETLLAHGADVHFQGGKYGSAIRAATFRSRHKVIELLLAYGAQPLEE